MTFRRVAICAVVAMSFACANDGPVAVEDLVQPPTHVNGDGDVGRTSDSQLNDSRRRLPGARKFTVVGACVVAGDDFQGDAEWSGAENGGFCHDGISFDGRTGSTTLHDTTVARADLIPHPDSGMVLQVHVVALQFFGPERTHWIVSTRGGSVALHPAARGIAFQSFFVNCPESLDATPDACFDWAISSSVGGQLYDHDEGHLCMNNPSSALPVCDGSPLAYVYPCDYLLSRYGGAIPLFKPVGCAPVPDEFSASIGMYQFSEQTYFGCGSYLFFIYHCLSPEGASCVLTAYSSNFSRFSPHSDVTFHWALPQGGEAHSPVVSFTGVMPTGDYVLTISVPGQVTSSTVMGLLGQDCGTPQNTGMLPL